MNADVLARLKGFAERVERGDSLSPGERVVAFFGVVDVGDRVRRARESTGARVELSPYLRNLCRAVGGSRAAGCE